MTHDNRQLYSSLSTSLSHSLEPPLSPPPSPLILTKEEKRSSRISPAILNNHLNNICTMAAQSPNFDEDYSLFLSENGHLSFENPNYRLDPRSAAIDQAILDDHLNSNLPNPTTCMSVYDELRLSGEDIKIDKKSKRKGYASLDLGSMGVEVDMDNKLAEEKMKESLHKLDRLMIEQESFLKGDIESSKLLESDKEKSEKSDGEEDTKEDKVLVKMRSKKKNNDLNNGRTKISHNNQLPPGWERHEDDEGPYFWHVKTGNIQREMPVATSEAADSSAEVIRDVRSSRIFEDDFDPTMAAVVATSSGRKEKVRPEQGGVISSSVKTPQGSNGSSSDKRWKRNSMPQTAAATSRNDSVGSSSSIEDTGIKIQVRCLGSVELREDELTPENSSKSVNRCIVQLSSTAGDLDEYDDVTSGSTSSTRRTLPVSSRLGDGKDMILELHDGSLRLLSPKNRTTVIHSQPIHSIRVWGVGRDNGQDFAYVARDKMSRKHVCHVFRCEVPARAIANALRDICKKILIERSLIQPSSRLTSTALSPTNGQQQQKESTTSMKPKINAGNELGSRTRKDRIRPTSLGSNFNAKLQTKTVPAPESFPTPMEEPRKVLKGWYLGTLQVNKPCGMDIINGAIDELMNSVPRTQWKTVVVAVAPSTVTVSFNDGQTSALDCRVRFLSFLGIGENPQQCAYIMHTAQDTFVAHVFHCEPTAGPLCKTIEAACKLRYQKCLDARPQQHRDLAQERSSAGTRSSIGSALKNMLGSWGGSKRNDHQPS